MTEMTSAWAREVSATLGPLGRSPQAAHVILEYSSDDCDMLQLAGLLFRPRNNIETQT